MKYIINFFVVAVVVVLCQSACSNRNNDPYFKYVVEGRVIDNVTKEPIENIIVSFNKHYLTTSEERQKVKYRLSPPNYDGRSDAKGNFCAFDNLWRTPLYFYDYENGLYKDTAISVDFRDIPLSGIPDGNYKGTYVLNIGDVELEKIDF